MFYIADKIEAFPILHILYKNIITTPEIAREFGKVLPDWIQIKTVTNKALQNSYLQKVDNGEASAIALAMELDSALLILDDLKGRKLALQLNLQFTGTLGVLISAKQCGAIPLLRPYFEKVEATNFRIPSSLLQRILEELGE